MKRKVYIRTDGGPEIGLGHVVRCISLAHMLKDVFEIQFVVKDAKSVIETLIAESGFILNSIESEETFLNQISSSTIVVLDGYHFTTEYQQKIKSFGAKLVCIDDLHQIHFVADLVLNHAPGVSCENYSTEPYTQFLLGPDYALIRPEFLNKNNEKSNLLKDKRRIMICFGGSDFKDLTSKTLSWIPDEDYQITVVTGLAYTHDINLEKVIASKTKVNITRKRNLNASEMVQTIQENNIAIVPSSGILFETIAIGSRIISGYYVDNQMDMHKGFLTKSVFYNAKDFNFESFNLAFDLAKMDKSSDMLLNQRQCIDGLSPSRIREKLMSIC